MTYASINTSQSCSSSKAIDNTTTETHTPTYLSVHYDIKHGRDLLCAGDRKHNGVGTELLILPQSLSQEVSHKMKPLHKHTSSTNHA